MTCANMLPIWIIKIKITMKIMFTRFEWLANKLCEMGPWSHSGGLRNMDPGLLFTNRFQADYWNLVRIIFVLTFILMIQSVHYFAHVTTAQLSWHVQRHDWCDHYFSFKSYMYHVTWFRLWANDIPVKLPLIFPGAPLIFNGAPGNIQGNLTGM